MRFRFSKGLADVPVVDDDKRPDAENNNAADNKEALSVGRDGSAVSDEDDGSENFQHGVKAVRAMTESWTKKDLIIAYVL